MLPGTATDALVRASIVIRDVRDGFTIVRSPRMPDYWFANCLVLENEPEPGTYDRWIAEHAKHFGDIPVQRRVVTWETTQRRELAPYAGVLERERMTVLRSRNAPDRRTDVAAIRPFSAPEHWRDALAMQARELEDSGLAHHVAFERRRFDVYRNDASEGRCRAWGVWNGDELVAFSGMYANAQWARFFNPLTKPSARCRGLFSAIAAVAMAETLRTYPSATIVIVAKHDSAAQRLYERLGFARAGEQHALIAPVGNDRRA